MIKEKDFEDILCKYSELIEPGLEFKGRQIRIYGRRMDIIFEDDFNRTLIVELKIGPIKDEHIGQILSYEGILLSQEDPTIRVMLIGNRVPPNIQKSLDHHGIAWKEMTLSYLKDFLRKKDDAEMFSLFEGQDIVDQDFKEKDNKKSGQSLTIRKVSTDKIHQVALSIANLEAPRYINCVEEDKLYRYSEGVYSSVHVIEVMRELHNGCSQHGIPFNELDIAKRKKVIELLKAFVGKELKDFNKDDGIINFRNCFYDIGTNQHRAHTPEVLSTIRLPYNYDEKATCPLWEKSLSEIFKDDQDKIQLIQEFFGYCLNRNVRFKKALVLVGRSGTGKSVIIDTLKYLLGESNCSHILLENINKSSASNLSLVNKLMTRVYYNQKKLAKSEDRFREVVSSEEIISKQKSKKSFRFRPYCKLIMEASIPEHLFKCSADLYKILLLVSCEREFGYNQQNNRLTEQLRSELSGILNWSIKGLKQLNERGRFLQNESVKEKVKKSTEEGSSVDLFFDEHVEVDITDGVYIIKGDLFNRYKGWCIKNKRYNLSHIRFSSCVFKRYGESTPKNSQLFPKGIRIWKNLRYVEAKK